MSSPASQPKASRKPRQKRANLANLDAMSVLEVASDSDAGDGSTVQLRQGPASGLSGVTASGRQSRARGATPRELADTFAKLLGGGSVLLAMWLEVEEAALLPDEANAIAEPLARIINRQNWGKALAKRIIGADDYLALSMAIFAYGVRIAPLVAAKLEAQRPNAKLVNPRPAHEAVRPAQPDSASNGHAKYDPGAGVKFDPSGMADAYGVY